MAETTGNYIFRIHNDGASDIRLECWARTSRLDSNKIRTIEDTLRKDASKVATSVPSPFARMHLFDTAFKIVAEKPEGESLYHQLVSDCLDIFQLLFNAGNSNPDIKFKQWNRQERIKALKANVEGHPHRLLAESLDLFFTNKFEDVQEITLIYYKNILLGGTSPFTIFFTSPNWHREMKKNNIVIGSTKGDVYFDHDYYPLHKRDQIFVEFIWKYYLANRAVLYNTASGLADYIKNSIEKFKPELFRRASDDWEIYIRNPSRLDDEYQRVNVIPNSSTYLQISDVYAYSVKSGSIPAKIQSESDYLMIPSVEFYKLEQDADNIATSPPTPLVLAKKMTNLGTYTYDNTPWAPNTDIRRTSIIDTYGNPIPLSARYLPGNSQVKYPFVTTEDFLEDSLIRMPFKLNNGKFFSGYTGDFNFLLPVKKEYFNFFTKDDLKKNLEIILLENKVHVKLRIPIRNKKSNPYIFFSKEYNLSEVPVAQCKASVAMFPFYRIMDNDSGLQKLNEYTVLFADRNDKLKVEAFDFWKTDEIIAKKNIPVTRPKPRSKKGIGLAASYYCKVNSAFDLIELKLSDESQRVFSGLIIPLFQEVRNYNATKEYTFAIDFGTSNTHISFNENSDKKPRPFEVGEEEMQMVLLNKPGESKLASEKYRLGYDEFPEIDLLVNREFIPAIIGKDTGSFASFPIRTTTCEKSTFQMETPNLFGNINIGFFIDSDPFKPQDCTYQTNLKWLYENSNNIKDPDRIEAFFKGLLLLIKNKVIINGGSIKDTRIVWLAPLSMKLRSIELFTEKWKTAFNEVFKGACSNLLEPITESVAPYFYLKSNSNANIKDFADALNIDIGGGTTDVMFFMRKSGKYLSTSFRFAGNDIWGDGFSRNDKDNGFITNLLDFRSRTNQQRKEQDFIFDNFMKDPKLTSEDVTSLLFHFDNHFRFSESINRDKPALKLIFFIHYSAIIYHLVQLIEQKQLNIPRYFTFTGKGSQYLNIMCSKESLLKFTLLLLKIYTRLPVPTDFKVVLTAEPKEATANGAVLFVSSPDKDKIAKEDIEILYHWGNDPSFTGEFRRNLTKIKEIAASDQFNSSVLKNLQNFLDKTLSNQEVIEFLDQYEISNVEKYKHFLAGADATSSGELYDSYYSILESMKINGNDGISETFFFLALKDSLYSLSKYIIEQSK